MIESKHSKNGTSWQGTPSTPNIQSQSSSAAERWGGLGSGDWVWGFFEHARWSVVMFWEHIKGAMVQHAFEGVIGRFSISQQGSLCKVPLMLHVCASWKCLGSEWLQYALQGPFLQSWGWEGRNYHTCYCYLCVHIDQLQQLGQKREWSHNWP